MFSPFPCVMSSPLRGLSDPSVWAVFARRLDESRNVDVSRVAAALRSRFALRPILQPLSTQIVAHRPPSAQGPAESVLTVARSWDGASRIIIAIGPDAFENWARAEFDNDPEWTAELAAELGPARAAAADLDARLGAVPAPAPAHGGASPLGATAVSPPAPAPAPAPSQPSQPQPPTDVARPPLRAAAAAPGDPSASGGSAPRGPGPFPPSVGSARDHATVFPHSDTRPAQPDGYPYHTHGPYAADHGYPRHHGLAGPPFSGTGFPPRHHHASGSPGRHFDGQLPPYWAPGAVAAWPPAHSPWDAPPPAPAWAPAPAAAAGAGAPPPQQASPAVGADLGQGIVAALEAMTRRLDAQPALRPPAPAAHPGGGGGGGGLDSLPELPWAPGQPLTEGAWRRPAVWRSAATSPRDLEDLTRQAAGGRGAPLSAGARALLNAAQTLTAAHAAGAVSVDLATTLFHNVWGPLWALWVAKDHADRRLVAGRPLARGFVDRAAQALEAVCVSVNTEHQVSSVMERVAKSFRTAERRGGGGRPSRYRGRSARSGVADPSRPRGPSSSVPRSRRPTPASGGSRGASRSRSRSRASDRTDQST